MREGALRYDPDRHHRQSTRLRGYDYRRAGAYFVTIVAVGRQLIFGEIVDGAFVPNTAGLAVIAEWDHLEGRFPTVRRDAFVLMPNHAHIVVAIAEAGPGAETAPLRDEGGRQGTKTASVRGEDQGRGAETAPLRDEQPTLGQVVAYLKYESTKRINAIGETWGTRVWQRNYFERVVRGELELARIREYIVANPAKWSTDPENSTNVVSLP